MSREHIYFNVPTYTGDEVRYITKAVADHRICGDGDFTIKCNRWFEERFGALKVMLTTSGTAALDMAAVLNEISPGDEVILPSFTFSSTANAAVLCGAKLVFVDIRPDTMNIDETKIEAAITEKTKAIIAVHYAGVACEMDALLDISKRYGLKLIEDAAQAVMSTYNGHYLGTIGDCGCYSFHETKNFSMGEGGAIVINHEEDIERAEILREKGTDRSKFYRGQVDKYTWVDFGDSYLPSELNAAYLYPQLEQADRITQHRLDCWERYYDGLRPLMKQGRIDLPHIPEGCRHNAHIFYIKTRDIKERTELSKHLKNDEIESVFHYIPLHSAPAGLKFGRFSGADVYTTRESERLLRLPMHCELDVADVDRICESIKEFYRT